MIYIYYKSFLLYFKKKNNILVKKIQEVKQVKGIPNFEEITKDIKLKKQYDFSNLYNYKTPIYINSPLFILVNKYKENILNNLIETFNKKYKYKLQMGIELEFYVDNNEVIEELKKNIKNINLEKEKGNNQFEIKTNKYTNVKLLINKYLSILEELNKDGIILDSCPFENDCGSALQINFSILDDNNNNLFARHRENDKYVESNLLLNCIAGLLKNINNNLLLYINNKDCLNRFELKKNQKLKENNKYPAPTFISWGVNNRSAAIRIPTPPNIDLNNYIKQDALLRRIEYRVPSSNANIYLVLIGIISSIIEGIDNNLMPHIEKTSFDVLYKNDGLEKIETDWFSLNDIFMINTQLYMGK